MLFPLARYCAGGNLRRLLSDPLLGPPLLWRRRGRRIALDAARGLAFLHSCGVVHRQVILIGMSLWSLRHMQSEADRGRLSGLQCSQTPLCTRLVAFWLAAGD